MRRRWSPILALSLAFALLVGTAAIAEVLSRADASSGRTPVFRVRGRVTDLHVGVPKVLRARVRNHFGFPIRVRVVRATVGAPGGGCPADTLTVTPWRGDLILPAYSMRRVPLTVTLVSMPSACSGATYPLSYAGRAVKA